jgi:hypothetical protein
MSDSSIAAWTVCRRVVRATSMLPKRSHSRNTYFTSRFVRCSRNAEDPSELFLLVGGALTQGMDEHEGALAPRLSPRISSPYRVRSPTKVRMSSWIWNAASSGEPEQWDGRR